MGGRRIKIVVAYDGTDFHGWQVQPELPTVQGTLEKIVGELEGKPVPVAGSGRTDAGVHALAQVAAFTLENPIPLDNLRRALNRQLPPAIRILSAEEVPLGFHPRFDAVSKTYEYHIVRAEVCPPLEWRYVHHHPFPLNVKRIMAAAPLFEGEHDFQAFAASDDRPLASTVRRIFSSEVRLECDRLVYKVQGSGFLKHMVRNMAGTLLEAGKQNLDEQILRELLSGNAQAKSGPTLPAKGLFLTEVSYSRPFLATNI